MTCPTDDVQAVLPVQGACRSRSTTARLQLLTLLVALTLPADALAAGFFLPIRGIRPTGRAGASVAVDGDPNAIWFNPANLTTLDGTHLLLDLALTDLQSTFVRTPRQEPNGDVVVYEPVTNAAKSFDYIPSLIVTSNFGVDRLGFAFGVLPPYAAKYSYPIDGPQRYSAVDSAESISAVFALAGAFEVTDWFRVGASFQNYYVDFKIFGTASAYSGPFGYPEDHDLDILMSIRSHDVFTPCGNAGLWFQIIPGLEVALSAQLPARIEDSDAELEIRLPDHPFFDGAEVEGNTVAGGFDLPAQIRGAVRWIHPFGDVELDVVWSGWSVHDQIDTNPRGLTLVNLSLLDEFTVGPLDIVQDWMNVWQVGVGSDFVAIEDRLTVRGGLLYEQTAIPDQRLSLFQLDSDKLAPSLGLTVEIPEARLLVDAAYTHFFFFDKQISNSQVSQINPTFEEGAIVVGNGDYSGNVDVFGLGVEASF
jgi:long-subunit fatty acid transport protein